MRWVFSGGYYERCSELARDKLVPLPVLHSEWFNHGSHVAHPNYAYTDKMFPPFLIDLHSSMLKKTTTPKPLYINSKKTTTLNHRRQHGNLRCTLSDQVMIDNRSERIKEPHTGQSVLLGNIVTIPEKTTPPTHIFRKSSTVVVCQI